MASDGATIDTVTLDEPAIKVLDAGLGTSAFRFRGLATSWLGLVFLA
jgi:hypothetical protein